MYFYVPIRDGLCRMIQLFPDKAGRAYINYGNFVLKLTEWVIPFGEMPENKDNLLCVVDGKYYYQDTTYSVSEQQEIKLHFQDFEYVLGQFLIEKCHIT